MLLMMMTVATTMIRRMDLGEPVISLKFPPLTIILPFQCVQPGPQERRPRAAKAMGHAPPHQQKMNRGTTPANPTSHTILMNLSLGRNATWRWLAGWLADITLSVSHSALGCTTEDIHRLFSGFLRRNVIASERGIMYGRIAAEIASSGQPADLVQVTSCATRVWLKEHRTIELMNLANGYLERDIKLLYTTRDKH